MPAVLTLWSRMRSFRCVYLQRSAAMLKAGGFLLLLAMAMELHAGDGAGVLTLERAYDLALATDQSIKIAFWQTRKADLSPWSALTRLGPQISANGGYSRRENSITRPVESIVSVGTGETLRQTVVETSLSRSGAGSLDLILSQPLIDLTVFPAYKLGKLSAESAHLAHRFTIRETLYGVTSAYFEVLKQARLVEVNRQTLAFGNEQLELAQKRAAVGEVTRTDVARAHVTVEASRRVLIESENILELDRNTLRNILNFAPDAPVEVVDPPEFPSKLPPFQDLWKVARANREDLKVKDIAVAQDVQRKNIVIAQYAPRVVAQGSTGIANNTGTSRSHSQDWAVDLSVQVPIFTGGQREIDLATAKYQIHVSELDRDNLAKTVEADVKQAWLVVKSLEETLRALRVQVAAAEQAYGDLQNQYKSGTATSVDVLSGLNELNISKRDLAVQIYDYQVALRNVEVVTGVFQQKRVEQSKVR